MRERIEAEWPLRKADAVALFVQDFALALADRAGIGDVAPWRLGVVRDYSVNAFSIGDGRIYITEGAILAAADEAELAAILAHEMGHDIAGHFCPRGGQEREVSSWWERFVSVFETPAGQPAETRGGLGSLRQVFDPLIEAEADRFAVAILRRAGYDPEARIRIAQRMAGPGAPVSGDVHLRHPSDLSRTQGNHEPSSDGKARITASTGLRGIQSMLRRDQ